jgi:hypothetical protein
LTRESTDKPLSSETKKTQELNPTLNAAKKTYFLGLEMETKNPLRTSSFMDPKTLTKFRYGFLVFNFIHFFYANYNVPCILAPSHVHLTKYISVWGFYATLFYSILTALFKDAPDNSRKWMITYIMGEVAYALQMMIMPVYFLILFPICVVVGHEMLENIDPVEAVFQTTTHLFIPIMLAIDIFSTDISFRKSHRAAIIVVIGAYLLTNLIWCLAEGKPSYPLLDWVSFPSYILAAMGVLGVLGAYSLGTYTYNMKIEKQRQLSKAQKSQ